MQTVLTEVSTIQASGGPDLMCTIEENGAVVIVSVSHVRGPWFRSQRLHSSFSLLDSSVFVPVASLVALHWNGAGEN